MADDTSLNTRLLAMRTAFDEAFARAPDAPVETRDLLVLGAAGERFALPLAGLTGVELTPPMTTLPSSHPALLGLANCRGRIVPVFSLARLLSRDRPAGRTANAAPASPTGRLCVLVPIEARDLVALAFEQLIELARVTRTDDEQPTTSKVLRTAAGLVPILDLTTLKDRVIAPHEET